MHYEKFNKPHLYRLNCYSNYNEHKGYYVLTKGKYKILYASISFQSMLREIKRLDIPFYKIHLNNMTLDDLACYCFLDERFERI